MGSIPQMELASRVLIGGLAGLVPLRSSHAQQGRLELAVGGRWHVYDGGEQQNGLIGGTRQLQAGVNARLYHQTAAPLTSVADRADTPREHRPSGLGLRGMPWFVP